LAQQTPSTQKLPVRHSTLAAQVCPRRFLSPHKLVLRSQMLGAAHCASVVHVVLHVVPLHANGSHDCVLAVRHVPAPSHVRASVSVVVPAGQLASRQGAPCEYFWQAPFSHMPFVPHVDEV